MAQTASAGGGRRPPAPPGPDREASGYFLDIPPLRSNLDDDVGLSQYLEVCFAKTPGDFDAADLQRFGRRCVEELDPLAEEMERYVPELKRYGVTGQAANEVVVSRAWTRMKEIACEEGLIRIGYSSSTNTNSQEKVVPHGRLHQFVKLHMFAPSSGLVNCPLAMTDGCCKLVVDQEERLREAKGVAGSGGDAPDAQFLRLVFDRMTTQDPKQFWTCGQWMTERGGGSDVQRGTSTEAVPCERKGVFRLFGYKWFSSAADGEAAITLARIQGQKQLSCFGVLTKNNNNKTTNPAIRIIQLKKKFGTHQLPTAELELNGVEAVLLGPPEQGLPTISSLLNVTRLYNSVAATGAMARSLVCAKKFSLARKTFGMQLDINGLHVETLFELEVLYRGCLCFALDVVRSMGAVEHGVPRDGTTAPVVEETKRFLRVCTPLLKLYTAKSAVQLCSEALELMGGLGYLEDSKMGGLLRDAQVLPVWEGTTNVLALDVVRCLGARQVLSGSPGTAHQASGTGGATSSSSCSGSSSIVWDLCPAMAGVLRRRVGSICRLLEETPQTKGSSAQFRDEISHGLEKTLDFYRDALQHHNSHSIMQASEGPLYGKHLRHAAYSLARLLVASSLAEWAVRFAAGRKRWNVVSVILDGFLGLEDARGGGGRLVAKGVGEQGEGKLQNSTTEIGDVKTKTLEAERFAVKRFLVFDGLEGASSRL